MHVHVHVLDHIVSLCYITALWMFTKLGRDEVLVAPYLWLDFGQTPPRGGSREGKNRSMRGPFSKGPLLRIGRIQ